MDVVYDFYGNRSTFEYEFEYEYEYVAVFMDIHALPEYRCSYTYILPDHD